MESKKREKEPSTQGSFFIESKQDMQAMFRLITRRYDFLNRVFSFGNDIRWRQASSKTVNFPQGGLILDLGAGTGDFSLTLRKTSDVRVVALDLVPEMLERLRLKTENGNREWLRLCIGDGEHLPFLSGVFDGVVAGFVGRNLFDLEGGLRETLRVLKKGSKIGFLEFCQTPNRLVRGVAWLYFHTIISGIGNLFLPRGFHAYHYLIDSIEGFYTREELVELFMRVGFNRVVSRKFNFGTVVFIMGEK